MGKSKVKKVDKGKGATEAQTKRIVQRVASKGQVDTTTRTTVAALVSVGGCKSIKTVATANQLAAALGLADGKRLRGWLRTTEVLGNDGRYSHYAVDVNSKDGRTLVKRASERFRADYDATMTKLVTILSAAT